MTEETVVVVKVPIPSEDGERCCAAEIIRQAIQQASIDYPPPTSVIIQLEPGVYKCWKPITRNGRKAMLHFWGNCHSNWTLRGATAAAAATAAVDDDSIKTTAQGDPTTILQIHYSNITNDMEGCRHLNLNSCNNFSIENLILDIFPRMATAAQVVDIHHKDSMVTIRMLEGMTHFDGMKCYPANNWNLSTRRLIEGPPITIGIDSSTIPTWKRRRKQQLQPQQQVSSSFDARNEEEEGKDDDHNNNNVYYYCLEDASIASKLQVGQGISFHFTIVCPQGRVIDINYCQSTILSNILVYNTMGMVVGAGYNTNLTFERFHIIQPPSPQHDEKGSSNSLAVGPRDGIHMYCNDGTLSMTDVIVKGVRWDPIVSYLHHFTIDQRINETTIQILLAAKKKDDESQQERLLEKEPIQVGSTIHFWTGNNPTTRQVAKVTTVTPPPLTTTTPAASSSTRILRIEFTKALDPSVQTGGIITPGSWHWKEAIIENCFIQSNYGTGLVFESDNLTVRNCFFDNNAYSNIGLGPTSDGAGMFCRNVIIEKNQFHNSTWQTKYKPTAMDTTTTNTARGMTPVRENDDDDDDDSYLSQHRGTITLFKHTSLFSPQQCYHRSIQIRNNIFENLVGVNNPAAIDIKLAKNVTVRNNHYNNTRRKVLVDPLTTENISVDDDDNHHSNNHDDDENNVDNKDHKDDAQEEEEVEGSRCCCCCRGCCRRSCTDRLRCTVCCWLKLQ